METKKYFFIVIIFVLIAIFKCNCNDNATTNVTEETKTETTDTVETCKIEIPIHDTIYAVVTKVIRIPKEDVDISEDDSFIIAIPTQKHYAVDTLYEAWVSGVEPSLDSIHIFSRTKIVQVTKTITEYKPFIPKEKNVSLGGYIGANSGFDLEHINLQGGLALRIKNLNIKAGYNVGEFNYPYMGVEYKIGK